MFTRWLARSLVALALVTLATPARAALELPPEPLGPAPAPRREPDEYPRRSWEAFPLLGGGAPFCRGESNGATRCGETGGGSTLGLGALYRLSPSLALGAEGTVTQFQTESMGPGAFSQTRWLGFLVRGYFLDRGSFDPYVETGAGWGSATARTNGDAAQLETSGPSAMAGVGIDFWVLPYLKLGPALSYRWTWLTDAKSCVGTLCQAADASAGLGVGSYASVAFVATLALGHEM